LRRLIQEIRKIERYSPPDFHYNFSLSIIYYDAKIVREAEDSKDGKPWKKSMVDEMVALDKNEAWDLVEFLARRNLISRKWVFKKKLNA
jgi:hypothetical protein